MAERKGYLFTPRDAKLNGAGDAVAVGYQSAEWTFEYLTQTELDWWLARMGGGLTVSGAFELWDDAGNAVAFSSGKMHRPKVEGGKASGYYKGVKIRFERLLPNLL